MAVSQYDPAISVFKGGITSLTRYSWVLIPIVIILSLFGVFWWIKKIKNKKTQWTHKLKVRREMENRRLSEPFYIPMRRFPLVKKAEVFELENPLLGGYLLPELDEYSGHNEFSIIIAKNNRLYTNKGEFFNPDKNSVLVSAKHSEIDIQRSNLKADFQNINKTSKRIEWSQIAKYAFMIMAIISLMIMGIVGIQKWGDAQQYKAQESQAMASAMENMASAMKTVEATVNVQKLEILPMLQELYGTQNIQSLITKSTTLNNETV